MFPAFIYFDSIKAGTVNEKDDSAAVPISGETMIGTDTSMLPAVATSEHRFLAITRERFLILDSGGKGVGHEAVVRSNNHLTEVFQFCNLYTSIILNQSDFKYCSAWYSFMIVHIIFILLMTS